MYSKFIKDMADKYGITYREALSHWKKAEDDVNFDMMMDPNKFSGLIANDSMSEEVKRRMESNLDDVGISNDEEVDIDTEINDIIEIEDDAPGIDDMDLDKVESDIEEAKDDSIDESEKQDELDIDEEFNIDDIIEDVDEETEDTDNTKESPKSDLDDSIEDIESK
jgi:hypothetical protein